MAAKGHPICTSPEHRKRRRPRGYRRHHRTQVFDSQRLSYRPERIAERSEIGHWECDLMMFRKEHGKINVTSLVERVSRYAVVPRNEDVSPSQSWRR